MSDVVVISREEAEEIESRLLELIDYKKAEKEREENIEQEVANSVFAENLQAIRELDPQEDDEEVEQEQNNGTY